jgi:hypothetical protein
MGYDQQFESYQDIETETVQVDANDVRITTRTFAQDGNRRKTLVDVTEESKHTLPNGDSNTVRITSRSDLNGTLQVIQREILETRSRTANTEETNSTVMLPSINGGFAPAIKRHELRKRGVNDTVETEEATLLPDGAGNWQVGELRKSSTREQGKNHGTDEHVYRRNAEGQLVEVSRRSNMESESSSGEKTSIVETYGVNAPGATPDGALHLVERRTIMQRTNVAGEQITEERVEQPNPGDLSSGLRVSLIINDTVRPDSSGSQATRTSRMRDANGSFGVVEVDTTKSDNIPAMHIPTPLEYLK